MPLLLLLLVLLGMLILLVEARVLTYAYRKIGVHPRYAFAVMLLSLLGSQVNIPLYSINRGATVVAVNVGGALIPILVSLYLLFHTAMYRRMPIRGSVVGGRGDNPPQNFPGGGLSPAGILAPPPPAPRAPPPR